MTRYTIGVDVGTTGTKTALLDVERGIVATASRPVDLHSHAPGWAEADTHQWFGNVVDSIAEVVSTEALDPKDVAAISTSGMVPAVILVDAEGTPLRRAVLQNDARAQAEIVELAAQLGHLDLVNLTGSTVTQQSVAPTLSWLHRHEPKIVGQLAHVVGSYDWTLTALGAGHHVERNWALESGLFTVDGEIVEPVLAAAGIDRAWLPPVLDPGATIGGLSAFVAERTGLREGTPLIVGGADHVLSAFAAGVADNGDWLIKLGGAGDVLVASDQPVVDSRLYLDAHPLPGMWLPNGCMATSGSLLRWYQTLIGGESLQNLDAAAAKAEPASLLCLPYFLGEKSPLHDPELRGVFAGLHLGHTRADMYRAVLEGIAFGFRHHVEVFGEIGLSLRKAMITNGGSKSVLWKQIHSDVLGNELHPVLDHPGASLGAALVAAIGTGLLDDWSQVSDFVSLGEPVTPTNTHFGVYESAYHEWRALGSAVAPLSHSIARRTTS